MGLHASGYDLYFYRVVLHRRGFRCLGPGFGPEHDAPEGSATRRYIQLPCSQLQLLYYLLLPHVVPSRLPPSVLYLSSCIACLLIVRYEGLHLMPNSISMATGSVFAGWMMHEMGRYKAISLILGIFPFVGAVLISMMREDSGPLQP